MGPAVGFAGVRREPGGGEGLRFSTAGGNKSQWLPWGSRPAGKGSEAGGEGSAPAVPGAGPAVRGALRRCRERGRR
jgi:hypothetical protein